MFVTRWLLATVATVLLFASSLNAAPSLPEASGTVSIAAQEWPIKPGPREIAVYIRYPGAGAKLAGVNAATGLMLSLHNWGGTGSGGSADPGTLAQRFNVVVISVDYLQSGKQASIDDPEPYDFGWLQGLDALRALHFVFDGLKQRGIAFDSRRIFTTGGSGGGNVSLMANKLAPRTFAVVIDLCGMKKLNDDIAYNLPGGSGLDARYVRDPKHPFYLSQDAQELRFVGFPSHLAVMKQQGCTAKIISVHGNLDAYCPFAEAEELANNMKAAGLDYTLFAVTKEVVDGKIFTTPGHSLGNRTLIVEHVAGKFLDPKSPDALYRAGPTDFERRDEVRYPTKNGTWVVDYKLGYPVGRFEGAKTP